MANQRESVGRYEYLLNGKPTDIEERWQLSSTATGQRISSFRRAPGFTLSVEATTDRGSVNAFNASWVPDVGPTVRVTCCPDEDSLLYTRYVDGQEAEPLVERLDAAVVMYPLMRIFTGMVIGRLAEAGGAGQILVPSVSGGRSNPAMLAPETSERHVMLCSDLNWPEGGSAPDGAKRWQFIGAQYDSNASFWLDAAGRLVRYRWQQGADQLWDVSLVEGV